MRSRKRPLFVDLSLATHATALIGTTLEPSAWRVGLGAILANHALVAIAGLWPRSSLVGPVITRQPAGRGVALTFDDGPDPDTTPRVLDLLDRYGASASFFCIGERAERWPDLVAETVARGHDVQNHSYTHPRAFALYGWRALTREVVRAQEVLEQITGRSPNLFRAPVGLRSPWLELILARHGLWLAAWTRRGFDTLLRDPAWVTSLLLRGLRAGDVLLLHDGSSSGSPRGPVVLSALEGVLQALEGAGLAGRPLSIGPQAVS